MSAKWAVCAGIVRANSVKDLFHQARSQFVLAYSLCCVVLSTFAKLVLISLGIIIDISGSTLQTGQLSSNCLCFLFLSQIQLFRAWTITQT